MTFRFAIAAVVVALGATAVMAQDPIAARKAAMKAIREAEWNGEPTPEVKVSPHATQRIS